MQEYSFVQLFETAKSKKHSITMQSNSILVAYI